MEVDLDDSQTSISGQLHQLLLKEVVDTYSIVFTIKVVLELSVSLAGQIQLSEVIPAVVPKKEEAAWLHRVGYLLHDVGMLLGGNGRQYKNKRVKVTCELVWDFMFDKVTNRHLHARLEVRVFLHLLVD